MDVSFISATYILPRFPLLLKADGQAICLIKPQFEVGKSMLGKGGIVKDPRAHRYAVERVLEAGTAAGMTPVGLIASPVTGGDGNREFLVYFINRGSDLRRVSDERIAQVTGARGLTRREDFQC
jgi:23S rRNA (cytidine1920-2'-O)/16S rRNA (cytidine1409-2'-O)-methyltransferase